MNDKEQQQLALQLWQELFEHEGFNFLCHCDWTAACSFCGMIQPDSFLYPRNDTKPEPEHELDCIYIRAKELVEEAEDDNYRTHWDATEYE